MEVINLKSNKPAILIRGFINFIKGLLLFVFIIINALSRDIRSKAEKDKEEQDDYLRALRGQKSGQEEFYDGIFSKKRRVGLWDIFTPWYISINVNTKSLTIRKRHWYLMGYNEDTFTFDGIINVNVKKRLMSSDIRVKMYGGYFEILAFSKADAKTIW